MIFKDLESYIEFIAGYRDNTGKQVNWWAQPVISLATYDTGFVSSVAEQTINGTAMSDRQASLAEKLIIKYERQLNKLGIEQPNHRNYRLGKRIVNRDQSLTLQDNKLYFRFPFNNKTITDIREFNKTSQGLVEWNKDAKAWVFALTEYNLSWVVAYAQNERIQVAAPVLVLFNQILDIEQTDYKIELRLNDEGKCEITNAADSLVEYITDNFGFDDLYTLVDNAARLGYTVDPVITQLLTEQHGDEFMKLCAGRLIDYTIGDASLDVLVNWAKEVNRLPIVVYNPNLIIKSKESCIEPYLKYFAEDEIRVITQKDDLADFEVEPSIKLYYTSKVIETWPSRLPVLISHVNLMHGVAKKKWMQMAEKLVYVCPPLPRK